MPKSVKAVSLAVCLLFMTMMSTTALAASVTILDDYWGADPTYNWSDRDIIGDACYFDVSKMEVTFAGNNLKYIDVYSRYFDNIGKYWTELGDLFISTDGWNPNGTAGDHYAQDNYYNAGETWEYALVLDNHDTNEGGNFGLYYITDDSDIKLSYAPSGYVYRYGQEIQLDTEGLSPVATGSWMVNFGNAGDTDDYLRFDLDSLDTGFDFNTTDYGFHWAASCGNDTIEGGATAPVPEPSTIFLLAVGFIGLVGLAHRKRS